MATEFDPDAALAALVGFLQQQQIRCSSAGVVRIGGTPQRTSRGARVYPRPNGDCVLVEQIHGDTFRSVIRPRAGMDARARLVLRLQLMHVEKLTEASHVGHRGGECVQCDAADRMIEALG